MNIRRSLQTTRLTAKVALVHLTRDSRELWESNLPSEVEFWDRWLATKGEGLGYGEDFRRRLDAGTPLKPSLAKYIKSPAAKILDVGAGPMTVLGKTFDGQPLDITAVDALASRYDALLQKYQISPPVRTRLAECEHLTDVFPPNTFDLSHAQNCLDHAYSPMTAIEQMALVTKTGGIIYLRHAVDEAARNDYAGLHRWNFHKERQSLVVAAPGRHSVNVSVQLEKQVSSSTTTETVNGREFVIFVGTKKP